MIIYVSKERATGSSGNQSGLLREHHRFTPYLIHCSLHYFRALYFAFFDKCKKKIQSNNAFKSTTCLEKYIFPFRKSELATVLENCKTFLNVIGVS